MNLCARLRGNVGSSFKISRNKDLQHKTMHIHFCHTRWTEHVKRYILHVCTYCTTRLVLMRRVNYSVDFSPDWLMSRHAWFMMDGMLAANGQDLSFLSFLFSPQVTSISVMLFVFLLFEMKFCMLQRCLDKQSCHLLAWPRGLEGNVSVPMVNHSSVIVLLHTKVQQKFMFANMNIFALKV